MRQLGRSPENAVSDPCSATVADHHGCADEYHTAGCRLGRRAKRASHNLSAKCSRAASKFDGQSASDHDRPTDANYYESRWTGFEQRSARADAVSYGESGSRQYGYDQSHCEPYRNAVRQRGRRESAYGRKYQRQYRYFSAGFRKWREQFHDTQ